MSRSSSSGGTARKSSGRRYLAKSFSVTRLTFTSVVCAESITATSSSRSHRDLSAMVASGYAAARRSMIGRMRARFGPTRLRASLTKLRGPARLNGCERAFGVTIATTEPRSCADDVERRTARADELVRRRAKIAGVDARDRGAEFGLELLHLFQAKRRRDDSVGPLEEVVD